jgi:hypothetical protein
MAYPGEEKPEDLGLQRLGSQVTLVEQLAPGRERPPQFAQSVLLGQP